MTDSAISTAQWKWDLVFVIKLRVFALFLVVQECLPPRNVAIRIQRTKMMVHLPTNAHFRK